MAGGTDNDLTIEALNQLIQAVNDLALKVGNGGCCHCNPEIDGPAQQEGAAGFQPCCAPEGFITFAEYEGYACKVSNWIADKLTIATKQMELLYFRFFEDYTGITEARRLSVTQIYQRIAVALPQIIDQQLLFTIPNQARAELITLLTDRYVSFQNAVIAEVPEVSTIGDVITEYWSEPFGLPATYLETNLETHIQEYYDQLDPSDLLSDIAANLASAAGQATGWATDTVADALALLATQGLANFKFAKNTIIDGYDAFFSCAGSLCDCTPVTVIEGTDNGGGNYASEFISNSNKIKLKFYLESEGPDVWCGPQVKITASNLVGWRAAGLPDFFIYNQQGQTVYSGDVLWPDQTVGSQLLIESADPFTVHINYEEDC